MSFQQIRSTLLDRRPLPPLVPKAVWDTSLTSQIDALDSPANVKAGLHLLNDDIHNCHELAQASDEPTSNTWHAILHRREGDYWNSKWWLSRISHPVLKSTHGSIKAAKSYVDAVEAAASSKDAAKIKELEQIQFNEMCALLEWSETNG